MSTASPPARSTAWSSSWRLFDEQGPGLCPCRELDERVDAFRNRPLEGAGETETESFWVQFLRDLVARGLSGVRLAISDEHQGLKAAMVRVLACPWQRCTVHFVRNMHGHCRRDERGLVSAALREIFDATDAETARDRCGSVLERFRGTVPKVAELLEGAEEDLLAFYRFPSPHWPKLRSTNPLERVNREVGLPHKSARRRPAAGAYPSNYRSSEPTVQSL